MINTKGRTPDPERAEALRSMPVPNNVTKLQAFLGSAIIAYIFLICKTSELLLNKVKVKLVTLVKGNQKAPFSIATT